MTAQYPELRMRRNRGAEWSRRLVAENRVSVDDLVWPIFTSDSVKGTEPVDALPGLVRRDLDETVKAAIRARDLGIPAIALFPHINPGDKSGDGREAANPNGHVQRTVRAIKADVPEIGVITDAALDPYTTHGHDGVLSGEVILNDETCAILADVAVSLAEAGADVVAPSDMMDGRVGTIRAALEAAGHTGVAILSYAAKYASAFYGPYRDAIGTSAALVGDKRTYQMDPANRREAVLESQLDAAEGADMLMVKPGGPYLDIIRDLREATPLPIFAYQVSGEYAMIAHAVAAGALDERRAVTEAMLGFKRAGCSGVLTYFAPKIAEWLG